MRLYLCLLLGLAALQGCRKSTAGQEGGRTYGTERFTVEVLNGYTPVKNQGRNFLCWAYAMLATIETEHIMRGDSVNLSVKYVARNLLLDNGRRYYLSGGGSPFSMRGMGLTLLNYAGRDGLVAYDAYRDDEDADLEVLCNKVKRIAVKAVNTRAGLGRFGREAAALADETLGTAPRNVYMLGARYTPQEFARSVCAPGEYVALTSFTHHPFYTRFVLEVPDNWEHNEFYNIPLDTLMSVVERAVRRGHGVCWEGDTSESGFSFARGTARLTDGITASGDTPEPATDLSAAARQRAFERFETTDDHCMTIVGLARDGAGSLYFIMKNSWGTANPYGGLMYVSADYVRMKTVAVYLPREEYVCR